MTSQLIPSDQLKIVERVDAPRPKKGQATKFDARFRFERFDAIKAATTPNYLVKGIVPREGITVVWGPPKCGKSFWTFDLAMHIALGRSYRGRKVRQGAIAYLALEGGAGFRARVEAWRQQEIKGRATTVPFYLLAVPVDLVADHKKLITAIGAQVAKPVAVVVDTLNRSLAGDENRSEDMARFIRAVDAIRVTFDCAVIVIHHSGIKTDRPRGHTSLAGANDAQIAVERDEDAGVITAKVEHMKDGEVGATIFSRLESVALGTDDEGDPITSCVVVPVEGEGLKRRPMLPGQTKLAFRLLERALADSGERPPASNHIPPDILRVVRVDTFRRYFDAGIPDDGHQPDSKRTAFKRATKRLLELGFIGVWNDHVWIAGHAGQGRTK
jgi:hypothetical protein